MDDQEIKPIVDALEEIYRESAKHPVLLAYIGSQLNKKRIRLPGNVRLKEFIEQHVDGMTVKMDPNNPLVYGVVKDGDNGNISFPKAIEFNDFFRSILVAFYRKIKDSEGIYIIRDQPYKYEISDVPLGAGYIEIEKCFRVDSLSDKNIREFDDNDKSAIVSKIKEWADKHGFDVDKLKSKSYGLKSVGGGLALSNALDRFIDAQPQSIRKLVVIPSDIAKILMRYE